MSRRHKQTYKNFKPPDRDALLCCSSSPVVSGTLLDSLFWISVSLLCCVVSRGLSLWDNRTWETISSQLEPEVLDELLKTLNKKIKCPCIYSASYHFWYSLVLVQVHIFTCHFSSFTISCHVNLLLKNSFSSCMSTEVFISSAFFEGYFCWALNSRLTDFYPLRILQEICLPYEIIIGAMRR